MPKRTSKTITTTVDDEADQLNALPPLGTWLAELDEESKIEVHTRDEEGYWSLRCTRPPSVITEEFLESLGSPAYYKLKSVTPQGKWGPQRSLRIAGIPRVEVLPVHNGTDPVSLQLKMMDMQMQLSREQGNKMHEIVLAMITAPRNAGPSITEMITAFSSLRSVTDNGNGFEHFKEILEMARDLPGGGEGKPDALTTMLGMIPKLIGQNQVAPSAALPPAKLIPGNPPAVAEEPPVQPVNPEIDARVKLLQLLKEKARLGKDPAFWADYLYENQNEEAACKALVDLVEAYTFEQIFQGLTNSDPELANEPYKGWFLRLYNYVKEPRDAEPNSDTPK